MTGKQNESGRSGQVGDPLDSLLAQADWPEPSPESLQRLEDRFGGLRRPGRGRLWWGVAAALVLAAGLGLWAMSSYGRRGPKLETPGVQGAARDESKEIIRLRGEIARLRAEAESRMAVVQHMLAFERAQENLDELRRYAMRPSPAELIAREVEQTAFTIVYNADRRRREEKDQLASTITAYREVIRLFPRTRSAEVARKRLRDIEKSGNREGDSS